MNREVYDKALRAMGEYLLDTGWKQTRDEVSECAWFQWIDPKTGMCHRQDFAFFVQSEREIYEKDGK